MNIRPIGVIRTCFSEKFGVPRQSGLVPAARGTIRLNPEVSDPDTVLGLKTFSHLWVIFLFHKVQTPFHPEKWRPTVNPPGLGAPERVGVFASRSPHRPNPIGMSVVKLEDVRTHLQDGIEIDVSGVDILDGSPVLDIKPYIPYADTVPQATSGWLTDKIPTYAVTFSQQAESKLASYPELKPLIVEVLQLDPRPRSQREAAPMETPGSIGKKFAFRFLQFDLHWIIAPNATIHLTVIVTLA